MARQSEHTPRRSANCLCRACLDNENGYYVCPLHASAPELLEAAKTACRYLIGQNNIKTVDIERKLDAAIAKAEGRNRDVH